jgi:hypothetical protein
MKTKKILLALFFFGSGLSIENFEAKKIKALAVVSAAAFSALHSYVVSFHEKKDSGVSSSDLSEEMISQKIYTEFFKEIPLVEILTSLYKETFLSWRLSDEKEDAVSKNADIFADALLASFYCKDFLKKFDVHYQILKKGEKVEAAYFFIGFLRGFFYFFVENEIAKKLHSIHLLENKKNVITLLHSVFSIGLTKGLLDKVLYPSISSCISFCLGSSANLQESENKKLDQDNNDDAVDFEAKIDHLDNKRRSIIDFGTLQARTIISLLQLGNKLRL